MENHDNAILNTQKLAVKKLIILFEIRLRNGVKYFLTPYNDTDSTNITIGDRVYRAIPMQMEDLSFEVQSSPPRPILSISNVVDFADESTTGTDFYSDIINAKLVRRTVFSRHIEKFNSDGTEATDFNIENTLIQLPKQAFVIDRVANKTPIVISLELSSAFDLDKVKLPGRVISGGFCPFVYKGASSYLAPEDKLNGCTWNSKQYVTTNENKYGTGVATSVPVYMNIQDEYIVQEGDHFTEIQEGIDGEPLIEVTEGAYEEQDILKNRYYKTEALNLQCIKANAVIETVTGYDYWQALTDILSSEGINFLHFPSDNSAFWRRVRVWSYYDSSKDFKAYTDKNRNEYAYLLPFPKTTVLATETFGTTTVTLDNGDGTTTTLRQADISSFITDESIIGTLSIEDENNAGLRRILNNSVYTSNLAGGLSRTDEYLLTINRNGGNLEVLVFTLSTTSTIKANSLLFEGVNRNAYDAILDNEGLWQISKITQEAEKHFTIPQANSIWKVGDVCAKALTSCALRFQATTHQYDTDSLPNVRREKYEAVAGISEVPIGEFTDPSTIPFLSASVGGSSGDRYLELSENDWLNIPDRTGYVIAYFPNVNDPTLFRLKNEDPTFGMDSELSVNRYVPIYNISSNSGDIRLKNTVSFTHANLILRDFFGSKLDDSPLVSPLTGIGADPTDNYKLEPVLLAYDKGANTVPQTETRVRFYRIPDIVLSVLEPTFNYPSPETIITEGEQIEIRSGVANTLSYILNNDVKDITDTTVVATAGTEYARVDGDPTAEFFLDFATPNNGRTGRSLYIATDRTSSNPLPFGGFPGTRRYN